MCKGGREMEQLVVLKNNEAFTNSFVIAEGTGVAHRYVKEQIRKHEGIFKAFGLLVAYATESTGGRPEEIYRLNEQQATFLITLMKNTEIVVKFKAELVKQFFAMRSLLLEKKTAEWVQARKQGKLTRQSETDVIKQLIEYAEEQGSINSDKLYLVYSKLANKMAGIQGREIATAAQLNHLEIMEHIILNCIHEGMKLGEHYKQIYKRCKARLEQFKYVAYLEQTA